MSVIMVRKNNTKEESIISVIKYQENLKQNRFDLSLLRVLATLGVIFIHTCSVLTGSYELFGLTDEQFIFFVCGREFLAGVLPLFFMITGVLLLKKEREITAKICLTKYVRRVLLALFIFGVPFSMMIRIAETKTFSLAYIWTGIVDVITGNSFAHLWYLYMLLGVYLILPMIKLYTDHTSHEQQRYLLIVLFLCNFLFPTIEAVTGFHIDFETSIGSIAVFFLLWGKYLDDSKRSFSRPLLALLGIVTLFVTIWCASDYNMPRWGLVGYSSPLIALMSTILFLLFKGVTIKEKHSGMMWKLDRLCFGVYLIHPVFMQFTYRALGVTPMSFGENWAVTVPIFWLAFVVVSFAGAFVMYLIPPLKKYVL